MEVCVTEEGTFQQVKTILYLDVGHGVCSIVDQFLMEPDGRQR